MPNATENDNRTESKNTMNNFPIKSQAAKKYRAILEATGSGILICRKDDLRQQCGGENLGVNVARGIAEIFASESILTYPALHPPKDFVLLVLENAACHKDHPETFEGDDPYVIAQRIMEQGFKPS